MAFKYEPYCPKCEGPMVYENCAYNKLYQFVSYIATDYTELSYEKVRVQRDDYVRMAKELLEELDNGG